MRIRGDVRWLAVAAFIVGAAAPPTFASGDERIVGGGFQSQAAPRQIDMIRGLGGVPQALTHGPSENFRFPSWGTGNAASDEEEGF